MEKGKSGRGRIFVGENSKTSAFCSDNKFNTKKLDKNYSANFSTLITGHGEVLLRTGDLYNPREKDENTEKYVPLTGMFASFFSSEVPDTCGAWQLNYCPS